MQKRFYFFIGTEAELIKTIPVINEFSARHIPFKIIASGQNAITKSELFSFLHLKGVDIVLCDRRPRQSVAWLMLWFLKTLPKGVVRLRTEFKGNRKQLYLIVHGDTISTVMGALIGKLYRMNVVHLEAGLRSFNWRHPFPEEIDRRIVSRCTNIHFCPNEWAIHNVPDRYGKKINTFQNTLLESLDFITKGHIVSDVVRRLAGQPYFIFVMHRQETLLNKRMISFLVKEIFQTPLSMQCVFVLHEFTKVTLERWGFLDALKKNERILFVPRLPYIEFMNVISQCQYIISDGGSNQEECYYFGKPTLIIRKATERIEGLGENVVLSKHDPRIIQEFLREYTRYQRPRVHLEQRPSQIVTDYLVGAE